jgi:serine/threonine-protein kinase
VTNPGWEQLQSIFEQAAAIAVEKRDAFLDTACAGDPQIREQIVRLLKADDLNANSNGDIPQMPTISDVDAQLTGTTIDNWRVLERVGVGGMGSVFRAERADGDFEQEAALKIVKKGMDSENVVARFRQERQILARLNHPNIASLLDGGVTKDGRPYFAMEFVDGLPITDYCDQRRLNVQERLGLFQKACDAVHFAHQNLVVHRDLKPANIFVTAEGDVKLLDFGIAKLLDDSVDLHLTRTGLQVHTPAYAAPEQLLDEAVTTATDVYALGAILYELISGRRPFAIRRSVEEYRQLVLSGELAKPSTVLTRNPANSAGRAGGRTAQQLSALRNARVDNLRKSLSGDLDTICLMALHREPAHRYVSAEQMAADIRRHLKGHPVLAQADSVGYRTAKFYRRHRAGSLATIAMIIASVTAIVYHNISITNERNRVRIEADRATATAQFLIDIFKLSDPDETAGETITAKEILDIGAAKLQQDLNSLPATKAALSVTIGAVYESLGLYDEALVQLTNAANLFDASDDLPGLTNSLRELGTVQYELGDLEAAQESLQRALDTNRSILPDNHVDIATNLNDLGHIIYAQGDYETAADLYQRSISMYEQLNATSHSGYSDSLHDLGQVWQLQGDLQAAEKNLRSALDSALDVFGERHSVTATYMHDLAALLHEKDDLENAESLFLKVMKLERDIFGEDHPDLEATMTNLGRLYADMNRLDESEAYLRKAVAHVVRLRGPSHTFTAYDTVNLANLLTVKGETVEAKALFEDALRIYAQNLDENHPYIASASVGFAALLNDVGAPQLSMTHSQRALAICEAALPDGHWLAASANSVLGESLMLSGELGEAETLLLEGYAGVMKARPRDRITVNALQRLIKYYELQGDSNAVERYRQSLGSIQLPQNES